MLKVTYKSGEVKEVQEPFKVSKEEYQLIEKVEKANDYRKYIKNAFQCFIHSVNFLSRNSVESPFVNCSFFGPPKLRAMMGDDNMGWYFQKEDAVDGVPDEALKDCGNQDWIEYLIKIILDLQDIFGEVMDTGDPLHDNRPIEFPVCTVNFSRKINENGEVEFVDYDYVEDFCKKHDIIRYNIYLSEGQKIASCCEIFSNPLQFLDHNGNIINTTFGKFVEDHLSEELGNKEEVISFLNDSFKIRTPEGSYVNIKGVRKVKNNWGKIINLTFNEKDTVGFTPNHELIDEDGNHIKVENINAGDYLSKNLKVTSVKVVKFNDPVYSIEVDSEDHLYSTYLEGCQEYLHIANCRLVNDVDLFELGGQVNSFGGSALSLGSHRVCTINMRRISLMCDSWEDYKKRLLEKMDEAEDILIAHRALLKDLIKKGTQPFISNGWLDLDRMFSTIGLLGYYEAAQDLTERFGPRDYLGEMVDLMEAHARELTVNRHNITNLEQIPAESASSRLANADHWIFDGPDDNW